MGVTAISGNVGSVRSAIAQASASTGIDFDYLLGQAQLESGMNPAARAGTSSATGLYQFIDQSWLGAVKQHGGQYGLDWAANAISRQGNRWVVSDAATRSAILNLRNDPTVSATMAAATASDNKDSIETSLGRGATGTDLYMAHFLGLGGAKSFLRTMQTNPDASAASLFPAAARANRSVFYDAGGNARSVGEIYQRFAAKLDRGAAAVGATSLASDTLDGSGATMQQALGGTSAAQRGNVQSLAAMLGLGDATVINGAGESEGSAAAWARAALTRTAGGNAGNTGNALPGNAAASVLRPTPANARLAYLMLASLGA